jgi:hypothetical protein
MLVSLSVSNFRSFDKEETFSLVASNRLAGKHEGHAVPIPNSDERVLRTGVLYGANGAGKSNLFKALRFLKTLATTPRKKSASIPRQAYRFSENAARPTTLDVQLLVLNQLYRFGVRVDGSQILEEWLVRVSGGREETLYERVTTPEGEVSVDIGDLEFGEGKLANLAKVGGPRNQTFLATVWSTLAFDHIPRELVYVLYWFINLRLVSPQQADADLNSRLTNDPELINFASKFLRSASTGIEQLLAVRQPLSDEEVAKLVPEAIQSHLSSSPEEGEWQKVLPNGDVIVAERGDPVRYLRVRLQAAHAGRAGDLVPLELVQESDGTRRLLQLIPALHSMSKAHAVYFIDEIDRSLHPMLVRSFLEFFLNSCQGMYRQLMVTTHESSLLDQELLRRDEIWFAEKDSVGATSLYSLLDFKVRNDLEIRKHYLQGRFGAVPFLGGIGRLIEDEEKSS